jgi:Uma2 family endonuclease
MDTQSIAGEQRIVLENIRWQTFEMLLEDLGDNRAALLAYDKGMLEIMSPLMTHEYYNRLIDRLIFVLAEELNLEIKSVGSMTCKRQDLARGIEPDSSYYIQNEPLMKAKTELDLTQDPPPDLVVEVDFSSQSLDKFPIYAALGVPEVWRYRRGVLQINLWQDGEYVLSEVSPSFANLPLTEIPQFLQQSTQVGELGMVRAFRVWVRERI